MFETILEKEGLKFLGWREVPIKPGVLGHKALEKMPNIQQVFIEKPKNIAKGLEFDRKLYVARRVFEQSNEDTYVVSLFKQNYCLQRHVSCRTVEIIL